MSELKPCPFCGGEAWLVMGSCGYMVECGACHIFGAIRGTKEEAIEAWNRRANDE